MVSKFCNYSIIFLEESDDDKDDKGSDKHKEKEKEKDGDKNKSFNDFKDYLSQNSLFIGTAVLLSYYLLFQTSSKIREISIQELNQYIENSNVKAIEIGKDKLSTFYTVLITHNDDSISKLTIVNNEQFVFGIETKLKEIVSTIQIINKFLGKTN